MIKHVIYNTDYGGFSYSFAFLKHIFLRSHIVRQLQKCKEPPRLSSRPTVEPVEVRALDTNELFHFFPRVPNPSVEDDYRRAGIERKPHAIATDSSYIYDPVHDQWYSLNECHRGHALSDEMLRWVKEYGLEYCSGQSCSLAIVKIPNDVDYGVDEYDGLERVYPKLPKDRIIMDLLHRNSNQPVSRFTRRLLEDPTVTLETLQSEIETEFKLLNK